MSKVLNSLDRPSIFEWALQLAEVTASRSTCLRRSVGCVLLDSHGRVIGTGYNGVARGLPHCNEADPRYHFDGLDHPKKYPHACPGAIAPSGTQLDACQAIHAEQNALLQCHDPLDIAICAVSASPCLTCTKLLMNTSCLHIVFREHYPHGDALDLWCNSNENRTWNHWPHKGNLR